MDSPRTPNLFHLRRLLLLPPETILRIAEEGKLIGLTTDPRREDLSFEDLCTERLGHLRRDHAERIVIAYLRRMLAIPCGGSPECECRRVKGKVIEALFPLRHVPAPELQPIDTMDLDEAAAYYTMIERAAGPSKATTA